MKRFYPVVMWVFMTVECVALGAQGMGSGAPMPQVPTPRNYPGMKPMGADPNAPPDSLNGRVAEQQARTRNNERQKKLEEETDKLVNLTKEFHEQVNGEKPMSPEDVGKRAEEIEKLARSVKDRMRG